MGIFYARSGEIFSAVETYFLQYKMKRVIHIAKSAENFTAQQNVKKSQFHSRNWKNVPFAIEMEKGHLRCRKVQKTLLHRRKLGQVSLVIEIGEKFILWQKQRASPFCSVFLWALDSTSAHKLVVTEQSLRAHSAEYPAQLSSQKKLGRTL